MHSFTVFIFATAFLISASRAQKKDARNELASLIRMNSVTNCKDAGLGPVAICANISTVHLCYNGTVLREEQCAGSKPFCQLGICTNNFPPLTRCPVPDGIFPMLNDCTSFYFCVRGMVTTVRCSLGTYYDPTLKACIRGRPCHKFNCGSRQYAVYTGDRNLYAFCWANSPALLMQCPEHHRLIESTQQCTPYCERLGNLVDSSDCRKYYECSAIGAPPVSKTCPASSYFDSTKLHCVTGDYC